MKAEAQALKATERSLDFILTVEGSHWEVLSTEVVWSYLYF